MGLSPSKKFFLTYTNSATQCRRLCYFVINLVEYSSDACTQIHANQKAAITKIQRVPRQLRYSKYISVRQLYKKYEQKIQGT